MLRVSPVLRKVMARVASIARQYRAALLDYLLGSGEAGRARAYQLGRRAIDEGVGLLEILSTHQQALRAVLESTHSVEDGLKKLWAAEEFLMDTLSPFEMTYHGFVALVGHPNGRAPAGRDRQKR